MAIYSWLSIAKKRLSGYLQSKNVEMAIDSQL